MTTHSSTATNITQIKTQKTTLEWLQDNDLKAQIQMALPKHLSAERMTRIAMTELKKIHKLQQCSPASFIGALIQCSQLGLEPGNNLGHAYLIPFDNKKNNTTECQLIIGYRGMLDLAKRSGQVISIQSHTVYENDLFEFEYGLNPKLRHVPARSNPGNIIYVYACALLKDGGNQFEVMSNEEIKGIMSQSKASKFGPWQTHYDEMARKTVIRRLFKYLPVSIELTKAITLDEDADRGDQNNSNVVLPMLETIDSYLDENGEVQEVPQQSKADLLAERLEE